ncbi:hypothetical protein FRC11_012142 [Ceratobasidium sp. 423]|nr:hypothetical protein FRC11_012142 [Ceratobasidium sp. 423]
MRKVHFKALGHDKPKDSQKMQEKVANALTTNELLKRERIRLMAEIEKKKDDHSRLSDAKQTAEEDYRRMKKVVSKSTE